MSPHSTLLALALALAGAAAPASGRQSSLPQGARQTDPGTETRLSTRHLLERSWQDSRWQHLDARVNEFTSSSQEEVCLATTANGGSVLAWQSRRQEAGTYGVYARLVDASGTSTSAEVHVNTTTASMQTQPCVAVDGQGGIWFSWTSFGQDGDRGAIVARRFDPSLQKATPELVVNELAAGHQDQPVLVGRADGGALVVWRSGAADGGRAHLRCRPLAANGLAAGPALSVDEAGEESDMLPTLSALGGERFLLAYARSAADGRPRACYAALLSGAGERIGSRIRLDLAHDSHAIEPAIAAGADGRFASAWFESTAAGYEPRLRFGQVNALGEFGDWSEVFALDGEHPGYLSGLDLALAPDGAAQLAWNRFADGQEQQPGLFTQRVARSGERGPILRATAGAQGEQRLALSNGARHVCVDAQGVVTFAWSGDSGLGDASGAHWTRLLPAQLGDARAQLGDARALAEGEALAAVDFDFAPLEAEGAQPHEPPTFDPRLIAKRPDEPLALGPGTDIDFVGVVDTGWTPPDPSLAAGPNHVVVMTNGAIAWFQDDGTFLEQDMIEGPTGFWGTLGATGFVFDPEVIFDPHSQRFMAMCCERASNGRPYFLLAISDDDNPVGTWFKYRIDVQAAAGDTDIDSPNISVDENVIYLTADFFGPDKFLIYMIDKSSVLSGGAVVATSTLVNGTQSMGMPVTYDTGLGVHYMIEGLFGGSSVVRLYAIQNPLTTPSVISTTLAVPFYSNPEDPPQLGTSSRPETFEPRFWSAVYRDGNLWATHHVDSTRVRQRWYQIAMNGWPSGGSPSLVQSGTVDLGGTLRTFFGSLWVDANQNMALTYARSSPSEFISMERTWRSAGDPLGTTRPGVSVIASSSAATAGRWGDYSSTVDDPSGSGFWSFHEYQVGGSWRTRIAFWSICPGTTAYCSGAPNSTGVGAAMGSSGSTSILSNNLVLSATDCPPLQPGVFYFGSTAISVPFGNGLRCAGGTVVRFLPTTSDVFGQASQALDLGNLPGGASIAAGDTRYFQYWYRDPAGGGASFNLTDGLQATFCP